LQIGRGLHAHPNQPTYGVSSGESACWMLPIVPEPSWSWDSVWGQAYCYYRDPMSDDAAVYREFEQRFMLADTLVGYSHEVHARAAQRVRGATRANALVATQGLPSKRGSWLPDGRRLETLPAARPWPETPSRAGPEAFGIQGVQSGRVDRAPVVRQNGFQGAPKCPPLGQLVWCGVENGTGPAPCDKTLSRAAVGR
jgi:hypothetical protein